MLIQNPKALALYVRGQRKERKLTQTDVGEVIGILQDTIFDFENRPDSSKVDTMFRIVEAVGLEIHVVPSGAKLDGDNKWNEKW